MSKLVDKLAMTTNGNKTNLRFRVDICVEPDAGEFHAFVPALKGLHVEGRTEEEAIKNAVDAAKAYIRSLIKHGEPIPISMLDATPVNAIGSRHIGKHSHRSEFALT